MQTAATHRAFVSDTTFSSPANVTTVDYVNGSTVLVYSSASRRRLIALRSRQARPVLLYLQICSALLM